MDKEPITNEILAIHLKYIRDELAEIKITLDDFKNNYVTKQEFAPIKVLVYGFVGLMLSSVVGALILLVIRN